MAKSSSFKSISQLKKKVLSDIHSKISEERSKTKIKNVNRMNVSKEVYSVYEPARFMRRADEGGLTDPSNIHVDPTIGLDNVTITLTNTTEPKGFDAAGKTSPFLAPVVEFGTGGNKPWEKPRPFMESTEEDLEEGRVIKNIIKEIDYIK